MLMENGNDLRNLLPLYYDFYIVAKEGSLTKAAEKNYVSQPSLTRSIQSLEHELSLILLNRTNKGITLTLDGEKLYKKLDEMFSSFQMQQFIDENELVGNLTIGTTRNIADNKLSKILSVFCQKYPKVKINILIDSATNLNDYLRNHKIDVLIDYLPHINYSEKFEFEVKAIGQFHTCFACSKKYYQKFGNNIHNLKDLSNYNLVIPGSSRRRQLLDEFLQNNDIILKPMIEMPDSKLMADFVQENEWIGYFIEEEADDYGLQKIPLDKPMPTNSIGIIYPKNIANEITKKFINLVLD